MMRRGGAEVVVAALTLGFTVGLFGIVFWRGGGTRARRRRRHA